ncbi:MAG: nitrate- and nitrite sensing domain-containing protein [Spirochaetota bacterium]
MTIKVKLLVLILIPIVGLLYFSISGVMEKVSIYTEMRLIESTSDVAVKISALVHESQKERGLSAGFLGSKGAEFGDQLKSQFTETDRKADVLLAYLKNFQSDIFSRELKEALNLALAELGEIQGIRSSVSAQNISSEAAIDFYSAMNSLFLKVISQLAALSSQGRMVSLSSAYVNFLLSKERTGIERGVLNNTFASNSFGEGMFRKFSSFVSEQKVYTDVFLSFATAEEKKAFEDALSDKSVAEVERMEEIAFERASEGNFGVDAKYWFDNMSNKINALREVEEKLSENLKTAAGQFKVKSLLGLTVFIAITILVLAASILISYLLIRGMLKQLGGEPKVMDEIALRVSKGDLTIDSEVNGRKKTGVFLSLLNMVAALKYKADIVERIASKDLTIDIEQASENDHLGKSLRIMKESLQEILFRINSAVKQIASGSDQVSQASQALSQGATEQASSLEEISSSLTEISGQAKQNSENAFAANSLAVDAAGKAKNGNLEMDKLVKAIENINNSSGKIGKIVKLIDDIAFQINLLALNANVEAARAGKYGKGFAVVAEEVRNLAVKSADAVKETTVNVEESLGNIKTGNQAAGSAARALSEIVAASTKVANLLEEITRSSNEQAEGIEQITTALNQIDQVTQANTASAEESAAAAEELSSQAQELKAVVSLFKLVKDESTLLERQVIA